MFKLDTTPIAYVDPWLQSLPERLARLGHGSRRVAYFYGHPDTSTFRYRVLNMIEALAIADPDVGASWFAEADLDHVDAILDRADVVVICRVRYTDGFARMVSAARARGLRVLFDVDDLIFDHDFTHLIMDTLDVAKGEEAWNAWFGWISRTGAMLRLCDGVILTNAYLAHRAHLFSGLPTAIVPNFLNAAQLDVSRRILQAKTQSDFARDGQVTLGYFSGTPSHNRDFALIAETIAQMMIRDPRLRLRIVGFLEPGSLLSALGSRVERVPLQDFLNLQRLIGDVEINLVPLQDNVFTNCKSELKVFEASVVGTISVASPSFTLRGAIRDRATGYIAPAHAWQEVLDAAIAGLDDYAPMALAAAEAALARFTPDCQGAAILAALFAERSAPETEATGGLRALS